MTAINIHDNVTLVELAAVVARDSTLTGSAVDLRDYIGKGKAVLMSAEAGAGTNPTLDVKLQGSADGSTGWADITGAAFTQVTDAAAVSEDIGVELNAIPRYVRVIGTLGGTSSPSFTYGVAFLGRKQIV